MSIAEEQIPGISRTDRNIIRTMTQPQLVQCTGVAVCFGGCVILLLGTPDEFLRVDPGGLQTIAPQQRATFHRRFGSADARFHRDQPGWGTSFRHNPHDDWQNCAPSKLSARVAPDQTSSRGVAEPSVQSGSSRPGRLRLCGSQSGP